LVRQIFRSTDCGTTWIETMRWYLTAEESTDLEKIGSDIYERNASGVFRSTDDGLSWMSVSGISIFSDQQQFGSYFFSSATDRLFRSVDSGAHWINDSNDFRRAGILTNI